jgi:hypothetical protein
MFPTMPRSDDTCPSARKLSRMASKTSPSAGRQSIFSASWSKNSSL